MKVALCFLISYDHILNKEHIWREWIEYNKDIINVYFHYSDYEKIESTWIKEHAIPEQYIFKTSYYHVVPAYLSLMSYAMGDDPENQWTCFLTDSCCPIISPRRFRYLFLKNYNFSVMSWKKAWWNPSFHKRANLNLVTKELRLANDAWFVLKREDAINCINVVKENYRLVKTVCNGGLANESIFAIMLKLTNTLDDVICKTTHCADWSRMPTCTSPHLFEHANERDIQFIKQSFKEHNFLMFLRKVSPKFPDHVLRQFIYREDDKLTIPLTPVPTHIEKQKEAEELT
jgi:hypothetical protein